jgi:hypothetical protein
MNKQDLDYYLARIAEEEVAAQLAAHPMAAQSHRQLAEEYASLIAVAAGPAVAVGPGR